MKKEMSEDENKINNTMSVYFPLYDARAYPYL